MSVCWTTYSDANHSEVVGGAVEKKKEKEKELTMEEKLAMLVNKFKK